MAAIIALCEPTDGVWAVSDHDLAVVRASLKGLQPVLNVAPALFFERLFYLAPSLRRFFPEDLRETRRRFVPTLASVVDALAHPGVLHALLQHLGARLAARGVTAAHYGIVGDTLIWTLERVLASGFTPEVEASWRTICRQLIVTLQGAAPEQRPVRAA